MTSAFFAASPPSPPARYDGSERYFYTLNLKLAVNAALTLQRPLPFKGEPRVNSPLLTVVGSRG